MPFFVPLLFGVGALALAAFGLKRAQAGKVAIERARSLEAEAARSYQLGRDRVEASRQATHDRAIAFAAEKEAHVRGPLTRAIVFLEAIERSGAFADARTLSGLRLLIPGMPNTPDPLQVRDALSGLGALVITGASASQIATMSAALMGVASTGTAIGSLSGAAATSATLAWLGGGALTVGGGGVALGRVVLGGVVIGPVMAFGGLLVERQGSLTLTSAQEASARVALAVAELNEVVARLGGVVRRIDELSGLCEALATRLDATLATLDPARWSASSERDLQDLQTMLTLATALGQVIRAPVLDATGALAPESVQVQMDFRDLVL